MTFFQQFTLGPISLRAGGGDNWSQFDLAFTTNRNAGQAARETAIRFGFKSDHLLALAGTDNANDTYVTPEGKTVYGKVSITPAAPSTSSAPTRSTPNRFTRPTSSPASSWLTKAWLTLFWLPPDRG